MNGLLHQEGEQMRSHRVHVVECIPTFISNNSRENPQKATMAWMSLDQVSSLTNSPVFVVVALMA